MWGRSDLLPRVCRPLAPGHEARQEQQRPWFLGWELRSGLAQRWDRRAFGPRVAGLDPARSSRAELAHGLLPSQRKMQLQLLWKEKFSFRFSSLVLNTEPS
jgi:hypothetical protein